ncbi:MAG: CoA transferase [Dehalococcoidia bacterium]|nr:CoA transferase [Dehalococcoidia bacterium]
MTKQVFEGTKVFDLSWAGVGPMIGRELAEHGATVIRVESHRRLDTIRTGGPFKDGKPGINRSAMYAAYNTNKYGISLDLTKPGSKEVARRLVAWADIVTDSMTVGTMAKLGLDYESCRKINPRVIYFSTTQQGQHGPHSGFHGFGHHANALLGVCTATGWPDSDPTLPFTAYCDFIAPWYVIIAVIGALLRRRQTGKGMYIEQSQFEAGLSFIAPHLLDYTVNKHIVTRMGNRDRYMCPHGVYACCGADRWVAIAVANEEQWQCLCRVIGDPDWIRDPRFTTVLGRKENEDELDRLIGEWTKDYTPEQVMTMMQDAGVPAGVVQTGEDLLNDPQLKHRQHYRVLNHPEIGPHSYNAPAYRLSKTPCDLHRPAPCLGEHNSYVYKEILGFSDDEIADMIVEGVITTEADVPSGA